LRTETENSRAEETERQKHREPNCRSKLELTGARFSDQNTGTGNKTSSGENRSQEHALAKISSRHRFLGSLENEKAVESSALTRDELD
jgi:hypothetical protein